MSLGNSKRRCAYFKDYRRAQLDTCGDRHGLAPRAKGSKTKRNHTHSIDTVDARRQVRQAKRLAVKAVRLENKRTTNREIAEWGEHDRQS